MPRQLVQREAVAFIELAAERAVVAGIAALGLLVALAGCSGVGQWLTRVSRRISRS
jgi:hypothetical protein